MIRTFKHNQYCEYFDARGKPSTVFPRGGLVETDRPFAQDVPSRAKKHAHAANQRANKSPTLNINLRALNTGSSLHKTNFAQRL